MSYAFSLLLALPGFVLCMLASGEVDVAAENEVLVELRRLAEQGDADAQSKLGVIYDSGEGVPEDHAEARLRQKTNFKLRHCHRNERAGKGSNLGSL